VKLISVFGRYIREVFLQSQQSIFNLFDTLGIVLFLFPQLASRFSSDLSLIRSVGFFIFIFSFIAANFIVFKQLNERLSSKADIHLKVLEHSLSPCRLTAKEEVLEAWTRADETDEEHKKRLDKIRKQSKKIDKNGLPRYALLKITLGIRNVGQEDGKLIFRFISFESKPGNIFKKMESEELVRNNVPARSYQDSVGYSEYIPININGTNDFVRRLNRFVRMKGKYKTVIKYWTESAEGLSETRSIVVKEEIIEFCKELSSEWESYGFQDLLKVL
jgi:hypothetical protein